MALCYDSFRSRRFLYEVLGLVYFELGFVFRCPTALNIFHQVYLEVKEPEVYLVPKVGKGSQVHQDLRVNTTRPTARRLLTQ